MRQAAEACAFAWACTPEVGECGGLVIDASGR